MSRVGFFLFPGLTQLDFTAPYEVLARVPGLEVQLIALEPGLIRTELGLTLLADTAAHSVQALDVLMVPGGPGINQVLACPASLEFLARIGERAAWVTSVCTGALALGKAGLLRGHRATTHWAFHDLLGLVGAVPVAERVVTDRNRMTGAGVTAGLDFAFELVTQLVDAATAERIRCQIEYDPGPWAPPESATREHVHQATRAQHAERRQLLLAAGAPW